MFIRSRESMLPGGIMSYKKPKSMPPESKRQYTAAGQDVHVSWNDIHQ